MMKFSRAALCVLFLPILIAAFSAQAAARSGDGSAQGQATVEIVAPISIMAVNDLEFGGIAVTALQGGSVEITAATGEARYSGSAQSVCAGPAGCTKRSALFQVKGEQGRAYSVAMPASTYARAQNGSGPDLMVSNLSAITKSQTDTGFAGILDANGADEIRVGGVLEIPAGTPSGSYSAEIVLVVRYN